MRQESVIDGAANPNPAAPTDFSAPSRGQPIRLSVVIPAYNEEQLLGRTLDGVKAALSACREQSEIIVVDNNSTDTTARVARKAGARVIFEPVNQIARARNSGARAARGDYLVFLDADTLVQGDILSKVVSMLDSGEVIGGGAWVEPDAGWFSRMIFRYFINLPLALRNVTVGPFLYCLRAAFDQAGGFDESYFAGEEFTLATRLREEGRKVNQRWQIIKYSKTHKILTSARKFQKYGGLEMLKSNAHLLWNSREKLRQKSQCRFWYEVRK